MEFNTVQRQAIFSNQSLLLVSAGAGSGKTRVLTERFVYLCEVRYNDPENPLGASVDEIVAITFTEKAAREMKDRIRKRMKEKENHAATEGEALFWKEQQTLLERAFISTFHSFCQRLLSQYALHADLPPRTRVLDDLESTVKKREILNQMFEEKELFQRAYSLFSIMSEQQLMETIEQLHGEIVELTVGEEAINQLEVDKMLHVQMEAKRMEQNVILQSFHKEALAASKHFRVVTSI